MTWSAQTMNKIYHVALREYLETVKSKLFLVSVFVTPLIVAGIIAVMSLSQVRAMLGGQDSQRVAVLDLSNSLAEDLQQAFEEHNEDHPRREFVPSIYSANDPETSLTEDELKEGVREGEWNVGLIVSPDVIEGTGTSHYYRKSQKVADFEVSSRVRRILQKAVTNKRYRMHGLSPELIAELGRDVSINELDVTREIEEEEEEGMQIVRMMVPFLFLFLMFFGLVVTGQGLLTSVIEEKSSRVIEVLLSALSPFQLMAGKIAGLAAVSLTVMLIWGVPAFATVAGLGVGNLVPLRELGYFFIYFFLGFVLLSSLFVAIGSACNTVKEAQSLMTPLMILVILPMVGFPFFAQHPDSVAAVVLSYIPPTTPMVMMVRIAADPELPIFQIVTSMAVLAASVPVAMWMAAKIFRTGILMYGKPPSLREMLRWVRHG